MPRLIRFPRCMCLVVMTASLLLASGCVGYAFTITVFGRTVSEGGASPQSSPYGTLEGVARLHMRVQAQLVRIVMKRAPELGVSVKQALAVIWLESGGECRMTGHSGERGAMQVLPATARQVGVYGNLYDCRTGIEAGLRYMRLMQSMKGRYGACVWLSSYNTGPASTHCTNYGRNIMALASGHVPRKQAYAVHRRYHRRHRKRHHRWHRRHNHA